MTIAHRGGHNEQAVGSRSIVKEEVECKLINDATGKYLSKLGAKHVDCSQGRCNESTDLVNGVKKANSNGAEIFTSIHMNNAYSSKQNKAMGVEIWVYKDKFKEAEQVLNKLVALGFKNRGIKSMVREGKNLYELKQTTGRAMIIECGFVESTVDMDLYKKLGADKIGQVIAEGLTGKTVKKKETRYSVKVSGMTDQKRQQLIIDFLKENKFNYKAEKYEVEI